MRFGALILLVLVVAAIAFVTAPWWTFRSLRDAARTGDTPALAKMVDYDSVRAGLQTAQTGQPAPPPAPSLWKNPFGAIQHMFAKPAAPPAAAEADVSTPTLADYTEGLPRGAPAPPPGKEPFPMIAFWGPDRCRITVEQPGDRTRKTEFTFERRGIFTWKLTRIVLPGAALAPAPATAKAGA